MSYLTQRGIVRDITVLLEGHANNNCGKAMRIDFYELIRNTRLTSRKFTIIFAIILKTNKRTGTV